MRLLNADSGENEPKFFYGGQAVMEGVMMRSAYSAAVAVRSPKLIAIDGADPVAYFEAGEAVAGGEDWEHEWRGAVWRFATEAHRDAFAEAPARWAPQYGGNGAQAMRTGARAAPDSASWLIHEDKLYLFQDDEARALFIQDLPQSAAEADARWEEKGDKRTAAEGEIVIHEQPLNPKIYRGALPKIPFLRGLIMLWDSLGLGSRALMWSADVALSEEEEADQVSFSGALGIGTLLVSLALGIGLFMLLPAAAAGGIERLFSMESPVLINVVEGLVRLVLVIGYIWAIGRVPDIKRLFAYHGAEHKTINAYEDGAPLTPEGVMPYPLPHTRCGTGFLLVVVIVSIFVFAFLHVDNMALRLLSRVLLVPVVAGIAYEWIRFTAKYEDHPAVGALIKPNLWLQRLTTNPPTPEMLEVSICALKTVLAAEPNLRAEPAAQAEPAAAGD